LFRVVRLDFMNTLPLPSHGWGPYSPLYLGASRILDSLRGTCLELALQPRRISPAATIVPDTIFDYRQNNATGERKARVQCLPENVARDYRQYSLRYFFDEGPDSDEALARFEVDALGRLCAEVQFTNNGSSERDYSLQLGVILSDPGKLIRLRQGLQPLWQPAWDYQSIDSYQKAFGMGCPTCVTRAFVHGIEEKTLGQAFGGWDGDRVVYRKTLPTGMQNARLYLRYVKYGSLDHPWEIRIGGKAVQFSFPQTQALPGGAHGKNRDLYEEWRLLRLEIGELAAGEHDIELRPINPPGNDRARIWLDGILFHDGLLPGDPGSDPVLKPSLIEERAGTTPTLQRLTSEQDGFGFEVWLEDRRLSEISIRAEEQTLQASEGTGSYFANARRSEGAANPSKGVERDSAALPWHALEFQSLRVPPGETRSLRFGVTVDSQIPQPEQTAAKACDPGVTGPFAELALRMRDALRFNVNYPMVIDGRPLSYVVPAKYFPLPYSWDAGFASLGWATFDAKAAAESTEFYFSGPGDNYPFFYCGSPVPTQIYSLWTIYEATLDRALLARMYPGAKRMFDFFLGREPGSVTHEHGDGLITTYAYNYNLGIDDHPVQLLAEEQGMTRHGLYSIILLPQLVRAAKIMRNIAGILSLDEDATQFSLDAQLIAKVIDEKMWDEKSALYGWLWRTPEGEVQPVTLDGSAGDRSACAFFPLFAGMTKRKDQLLPQLKDAERFFTPFGVSSVDRLAPSYLPNGYWNGGMWPVMQWYLWRGLIEANEPELARELADRVLATWQKSLTEEHYLGEHFPLNKEYMSGAPTFAGLNASLLAIHAAYYQTGWVTLPFDVVLLKRNFDRASGVLELQFDSSRHQESEHVVLVNVGKAAHSYEVDSAELHSPAAVHTDAHGHLSLAFKRSEKPTKLVLRPR